MCPKFQCHLFCEHGFKTEGDCSICKCNEETPTSPKGIARGCNLVKCSVELVTAIKNCSNYIDWISYSSVCPPACNMFCIHGLKVVDGCPICECNEPPTSEVKRNISRNKHSNIFCSHLIIQHLENAENLKMFFAECPLLLCDLHCEHGFRRDGKCEVCECNTPWSREWNYFSIFALSYQKCKWFQTAVKFFFVACPPFKCPKFCEHVVKTVGGCEVNVSKHLSQIIMQRINRHS